MAITFNNIPANTRTPGVYTEVDNSRAIKGLVPNPFRVLIVGSKEVAGSAATLTPTQITRDGAADGFFGVGSLLARMCAAYRLNNPYTEMWAIAASDNAAGTKASCALSFAGSALNTGTVYLMIGGVAVTSPITSGWSAADVCSGVKSDINANSYLCMTVSYTAGASIMYLLAKGSGEFGNYFDVRINYYNNQVLPSGVTYVLTARAGGTNNPTMADVWAVAKGTQYDGIIHPYIDAANLAGIEAELTSRMGPMVDQQAHAFTAVRATLASATTIGLTRNSPYQTMIAANDSPTNPEEWAAALGGVGMYYLNNDPMRPLQYLPLMGVLPPTMQSGNRFVQSDRNTLLYDGLATWIVDANGLVNIERCITMYRTNAVGLPDPSYLDTETMFTLKAIRYQYKTRMFTRFILPRFKITDDGNPIVPGSYMCSPSTIKQEIIALFTILRDQGFIENLPQFVGNLIVERDANDVTKVNVLLPPNLVNQFRILAGTIQFLL